MSAKLQQPSGTIASAHERQNNQRKTARTITSAVGLALYMSSIMICFYKDGYTLVSSLADIAATTTMLNMVMH